LNTKTSFAQIGLKEMDILFGEVVFEKNTFRIITY